MKLSVSLLASLTLILPTLSTHAEQYAQQRLTPAKSALYIADIGYRSIMRCAGDTGKILDSFDNVTSPLGLAFGPDSKLYVASYDEGCVLRFDSSTGHSLGTFIPRGSGWMLSPLKIAFGPDHNLYVVTRSRGGSDIRRYSGKTGSPMGLFVAYGTGGMVDPADIAFGPDGNLYVANKAQNEILRFNGKTGVPMKAFVHPNAKEFLHFQGSYDKRAAVPAKPLAKKIRLVPSPYIFGGGMPGYPYGYRPSGGGLSDRSSYFQNMVFGPNGDLYAGGDAGVLQFNGKTGDFERVFAPIGSHLSNIGGMAFGPDGDLYVGDWWMNDVVRYNGRTAAFEGVFVSPKSGLRANRCILFGPR